MVMSEDQARAAVESGRVKSAFGADHKSFGEFILGAEVRKATAEVAGDIRSEVAAGSARGSGPGPHMADEWAVNAEAGTIKVGKNIRVRVDVINPNIAASAQEFGAGTREHQRTRLLGRTAGKYGDFHDHGEGKA